MDNVLPCEYGEKVWNPNRLTIDIQKLMDYKSPPAVDKDVPYLKTVSLRRVHFLNPHPDEIEIEDIAYHLARLPRFAGGTLQWYSVAEHLILCYRLGLHMGACKELLRALLLHDGSEFITGDIPGPLKKYCPGLQSIEDGLTKVINIKYNVDDQWHGIVKSIDDRMYLTECTFLRNDPKPGHIPNFRFPSYTPEECERIFLECFNECKSA